MGAGMSWLRCDCCDAGGGRNPSVETANALAGKTDVVFHDEATGSLPTLSAERIDTVALEDMVDLRARMGPIPEDDAEDAKEPEKEALFEADASPAVQKTVAFEVILEKTDDNKNIGLSNMDDRPSMVVVSVAEGSLVDKWNRSPQTQEDRRVKPGSVIEEVNGVKGGLDELEIACEKACAGEGKKKLILRVRRQKVYTVHVKEKKTSLGIELLPSSMKFIRFLEPTDACPSSSMALYDYNQNCADGEEMIPGDAVVAVNNQRGEPKELREALRFASYPLTLVFERP